MSNTVQQSILSAPIIADFKRKLSSGTVLRENELLSRRTTLRVGGPADLLIEPGGEEDLAIVLEICREHQFPIFLLGRGSNLLVRDGGIRGVVISLGNNAFSRIEISGERILCGAGARLRSVAFEAKKASLTSVEFMEGIPGNIGGALRMNAGAMGTSMFQVLESIRYMSFHGKIEEKSASEIPVEYRNCAFFKDHIALSAILIGKSAARSLIEERMNECSQKRWSSQPAAPSAGCIFKNAPTIPAGRLVQELGLKGTRIGGAMISDVHGNFIVNDANASAHDILALIDLVKEKALAQRGIELHTEVQIVGEELE
jgi:UDP-N-acetylenolpyruvoylglucosamine reductase